MKVYFTLVQKECHSPCEKERVLWAFAFVRSYSFFTVFYATNFHRMNTFTWSREDSSKDFTISLYQIIHWKLLLLLNSWKHLWWPNWSQNKSPVPVVGFSSPLLSSSLPLAIDSMNERKRKSRDFSQRDSRKTWITI